MGVILPIALSDKCSDEDAAPDEVLVDDAQRAVAEPGTCGFSVASVMVERMLSSA